MKYKNKNVIVTGGGQGIGACIAKSYALEGASVIIIDNDSEAGMETEQNIKEANKDAHFIECDVADEQQIKETFAYIEQQYGKIDIVVNNAAIDDNSTMFSRDIKEWNRILAINLTGPYIITKYSVPIMSVDGGNIINICSTRALMSEAHTEPYTASKGGLLALTHSLAVTLGPKIRVNAISPGWIDVSSWKKQKNRKFTHISESSHAQHPVGRVGLPEDIAKACLYLTSEDASFITGMNLILDGGMTIKMIYE